MSDITYDWIPFETVADTQAPIEQAIKIGKGYSREEEFRSPLDSFMADYRKHHAMMSDTKGCSDYKNRFTFFRRFYDWAGISLPVVH